MPSLESLNDPARLLEFIHEHGDQQIVSARILERVDGGLSQDSVLVALQKHDGTKFKSFMKKTKQSYLTWMFGKSNKLFREAYCYEYLRSTKIDGCRCPYSYMEFVVEKDSQ